jgi:hypothetical protein
MRTVSDLASLAASVTRLPAARSPEVSPAESERARPHRGTPDSPRRSGQLWKGSPCLPHPWTSRKGGVHNTD